MRVAPTLLVALLTMSPALAQQQAPPPPAPQAPPTQAVAPASAPTDSRGFSCAQIPAAQHFLDGLRPGPNTSRAQQHLDAAKSAQAANNDQQCVAELRQVDHYARRSAAADRHATKASAHTVHRTRHRVLCADPLHQDRPGGSDYHGPPVAGCPRVP
jgi:hypothetical protein